MGFDVIVVGAGSTGATLAARLSERATRSVLLLEAGEDYSRVEDIPQEYLDPTVTAAAIPGHPGNWAMPGTFMPGFDVPVPRGKVVGGSSSINGTYFVRGLRQNFDEWADLGHAAWSYEQVLPYFRKLETDHDFHGDEHGTSGPIPVRREGDSRAPAFIPAFVEACREVGFPDEPDKNAAGDGFGVGPVPLNIGGQMRYGTALGYVMPARQRANLMIQGSAFVRRVLFDRTRAYGVEADVAGERVVYEADEIVLSLGALRSPHLLMVSGVGPGDDLSRHGIRVVAELPGVGRNLMDHPELVANYHLAEPHPEAPGAGSIGPAVHWTAEDSDHPSDLEMFPFLRTARSLLRPAKVLQSPVRTLRAMRGTSPRALLAHLWSRGSGSVVLGLQQEESRGGIRLTSAAPESDPILEYNFLSAEFDRVRFREAVKQCWSIFNALPLQRAGCELVDLTPSDLRSNATMDEWVRHHLKIAGHPTSTCSMGSVSDPDAVVDEFGRVHGVCGLRIADTSIWPKAPSRGPNATAIMTGERIAAFMDSTLSA